MQDITPSDPARVSLAAIPVTPSNQDNSKGQDVFILGMGEANIVGGEVWGEDLAFWGGRFPLS